MFLNLHDRRIRIKYSTFIISRGLASQANEARNMSYKKYIYICTHITFISTKIKLHTLTFILLHSSELVISAKNNRMLNNTIITKH